jgi:hypothetical protein
MQRYVGARLSLRLARGLFAVVGGIAVLVGAGQTMGALSPGSRVDWLAIGWGLGLGAGALAAAAFLGSQRRLLWLAAGFGIAAVFATSLWPLYYLATHADGSADVLALAVIPSVVGLAATTVMARAHWQLAMPAGGTGR